MDTLGWLNAEPRGQRGPRLGHRAACVSLALVALAPVASGSDPQVPPGVQAALTLRILEYDRGVKSWARGGLTVGVVVRDMATAAEYGKVLAGQTVQGIPVKVVDHAYRDAEGALLWAERSGVRLLYVDAELEGEVPALLTGARGRNLVTLTLTRTHFEAGGVLGLVVREGKPHILVNLARSRAVGMDLDPKLLQLSEVVR